MGAQQSVCWNVTGRDISTGRYVLCQGMNSMEHYDCVPVELGCPIVIAAAHIAIVDVLPVAGVNLLLGNYLAGARLFPSPTLYFMVPEETFDVSAGMKNRFAVVEVSLPMYAVVRSMAR